MEPYVKKYCDIALQIENELNNDESLSSDCKYPLIISKYLKKDGFRKRVIEGRLTFKNSIHFIKVNGACRSIRRFHQNVKPPKRAIPTIIVKISNSSNGKYKNDPIFLRIQPIVKTGTAALAEMYKWTWFLEQRELQKLYGMDRHERNVGIIKTRRGYECIVFDW